MSKKKVLIYLAIPTALTLTLIAMYFSGNLVLQRIVCPKLPPLSPDAWREFGLLESLQHLFILAILVAACIGALRKKVPIERIGFLFIALFSAFMLLEEIDYGDHYITYLGHDADFEWFLPVAEWSPELIEDLDLDVTPFNLHNRGDLTNLIKDGSTVIIILLFVLAPFVGPRHRNPWAKYLAPDKYALLTVIAMVLLSSLAHYLGDRQWDAIKEAVMAGLSLLYKEEGAIPPNLSVWAAIREVCAAGLPVPYDAGGAIRKNLSEFRELTMYYLFLVYVIDLVFCRRFRSEDESPEDGVEAEA